MNSACHHTIAQELTHTSGPLSVDQNGSKRHTDRAARQRGFNLTGILPYLVVAGILALAIWGIFRFAMGTAQYQIEGRNATSIVTAARSLKVGGSYANVDNAAVQRVKGFGNMTGSASGGTVKNGWGGTVVVSGTVDTLTLQYNGVPEDACDRFIASMTDSGMFTDPLPTCNTSGSSDLSFTAN
ncbi:type 4 pilus major pilin [Achromobacter aloeverae]